MYKINIEYNKTSAGALYARIRVIETDVGQTPKILKNSLVYYYELCEVIDTPPRMFWKDCFEDVRLHIDAAKKEIIKIREYNYNTKIPIPESEEIIL